MPLTDVQRAHLHPQLADLRSQCEEGSTPDRASCLHRAMEGADATPIWDEWENFVRAELGSLPAALARPAGPR